MGRDPRAGVLTRRTADVGPLVFGAGRECTFPGSLAAATKSDYDWLMGCSGAAFATGIDPVGWDPLAASPRDPSTRARAAAAAGVRLDELVPPYDDELRELVMLRIREAVDDGLPPLVRGAVGPPEYGVIVAYVPRPEGGDRLRVRTYFDKGDAPSEIDGTAFVDTDHGTPIFLDRAPAVDRGVLAAGGLDAATLGAAESDEAMRTWISELRDDSRWADARHTATAAFADHAMRQLLADKRRAAARFLRGLRSTFATLPGSDLLRAAESYGYVADAADKFGIGPFNAATAMRFGDGGQRRAWANLLEGALEHERSAHEAIRSARASIRT